MARISARPTESLSVKWPELTGEAGASAEGWRAWLESAWTDGELVSAIEVAAGAQLTERVAAIVAGGAIAPVRLRRLVLSVMRYALRAGRATPFGLFAGVGPARFGDRTDVPEGTKPLAVARVDAIWLDQVVRRLEDLLLERLPVAANTLCVVRGGRLVLPVRPGTGASGPVEASVRLTGAVELVLETARKGCTIGELTDRLLARFPQQSAASARRMLGTLMDSRVLLSVLRAPTTAVDPLEDLLGVLDAVRADEVPQVGQVLADLRAVQRDVRWHNDQGTAAAQREARGVLVARMRELMPESGQCLMVDLRWPGEITLPQVVREQAERAAALLTRLSPRPDGHPAWAEYHGRFVDLYGPGAVVAVTDLLNPDTGLGLPARYRGSQLPEPARRLSRRDERLFALAQRAAVEGSVEVLLDDDLLDHLAPDAEPAAVQPNAEITFHLAAGNQALLDQSSFTLTVTGAPRAAATTTGRFLYLLGEEWTAQAQAAATLREDAVAVQVSAPPLVPKVQNVTRAPEVLPVLHLGEHPGLGSAAGVRLEELGVCADERRMWLVHLADGLPVEPRMLNAAEFRSVTDPVVRFLCEITNARTPQYTGFDWGAAGRLPFLPRLRHGRIVLAPAQWRLPAADLPGFDATWPQWESAVRGWLRTYHVLQHVNLRQRDLKLPLDLQQSAHLALLRDHLQHDADAVLSEAPVPGANGWTGGRAHEITVQLDSTLPQLPNRRHRCPVRTVRPDSGHLPGASPWLSARLYGNPDRVEEILHEHLPRLLGQWINPPQWWFLRHVEGGHHLRLRLRLPQAAAFTLAGERVGEWTRQLRAQGLVTRLTLDTYQPETGRYGHGAVLDLAEQVFAADSRAVLLQLAYARQAEKDLRAVAAAGLCALTTGLLGTGAGLDWLLDRVPHRIGVRVDRDLHQQAVRLGDLSGGWAELRESAAGRDLLHAWAARASVLADYRHQLNQSGELRPETVVGSLLHLHVVRMLGIDADGERLVHHLARAAASAACARQLAGAR
ncbi:lantibiotic dehydratase [Kitasatospora sp. NPDC101801]|uniref:lantibiotic dehydratase n=1 Tax=Kitasatospora sp. NPDC101801 TaxID=3364103 RepID=UPI00382A310E